MRRSDGRTRPRKRWIRRVLAVASIIFVAFAIGVWRFSWWAPAVYAPGPGVVVRGTPLASAEHDERVVQLGRDEPYILHIEAASAASDPETTSGQSEVGAGGGRGSLLYFGALHSKDPNHPEQAELRRVWREFRPTVALVEGRMGFFVGTATQGIRIFGEGAAVYAMAERDGIRLHTLEPPLEVEIAALEECGDRTQVGMFRFLSGYMSARRGGPVSEFKIDRLLSKRARPLTEAFATREAFDKYFASQFPDETGWRDLPEQAMWPGRSDTLLHRMATRSNEARDEHFNRVMIDLVNRGERVLAIAGRSHTVVQEPVLWESLQPASVGGLSSRRPWASGVD